MTKRSIFQQPINVENWPSQDVSVGPRDGKGITDYFEQKVYIGDLYVGTVYSWMQPVQQFFRRKPAGMKLEKVYASEKFSRQHHPTRWRAIVEIVNAKVAA